MYINSPDNNIMNSILVTISKNKNIEDIFYNCLTDFNDDESISGTYAMDLEWNCSIKNEEPEKLFWVKNCLQYDTETDSIVVSSGIYAGKLSKKCILC